MTTVINTTWCWQHFVKGKQKYRNDQSHFESRCRACITHRIEELREQDKKDIQEGNREYTRPAEELEKQGASDPNQQIIFKWRRLSLRSALQDVAPVSSKAETMLSHLSSCEHADPGLQDTAAAASKKENGRTV
jgi:ribosomal protein L44E